MAIDPKVYNLIKFIVLRGSVLFAVGYSIPHIFGIKNLLTIVGLIVSIAASWRIALSIYRRMIIPAKKPKEYGKWAIVTGSTSGIGKEFADYLAKEGMSILLISRNPDKLREQEKELKNKYGSTGVEVSFLAFDFTKSGPEKDAFYRALNDKCIELDNFGGQYVLIMMCI